MNKNKIKLRNALIFVLLIVVMIIAGAVIENKQNKYNKFFVEKMHDEINNEKTVNAENEEELTNINTDDLQELEELDGIGEKMAERIIKYRKENGNFEVIEDLMKVDGIGKKKFDKIKDRIFVGE